LRDAAQVGDRRRAEAALDLGQPADRAAERPGEFNERNPAGLAKSADVAADTGRPAIRFAFHHIRHDPSSAPSAKMKFFPFFSFSCEIRNSFSCIRRKAPTIIVGRRGRPAFRPGGAGAGDRSFGSNDAVATAWPLPRRARSDIPGGYW